LQYLQFIILVISLPQKVNRYPNLLEYFLNVIWL
jgi:hypothetical protein